MEQHTVPLRRSQPPMTPVASWFSSAFEKVVTMALAECFLPLGFPHSLFFRSYYVCNMRSCSRGLALTTRGLFSRSARCHWAKTTNVKHVLLTAGGNVEKLWREFFSDPSQWWDHRPEKANPKYPDFKHKKTQQSLWLNSNLTPRWVESELAALSPSFLHSNTFSWNIKLRRYVKAGDYRKTLDVYQQMGREGMIPDKFTFVPVLNACSGLLDLEEGRRVHLQVIKSGFEFDVFVGSCLVDMYAKCGRIEDARRLFNKMPTRDVVSWSALILGYVRCGQQHEALKLSGLMQREGVDLNRVTFIGVLNACASIGALEEGRRAHKQIIDRGYESDIFVATALVDMYARCGSLEDACRVFNKMPKRNAVSWTALILGYVKCGQGHEALELSHQMQLEGVDLDPVTFVGVLNGCASIGALEEGRRAHQQIIDRGYEYDVYLAVSLIDMYAKCGSIGDAQRVFDKMPTRDVISWSAMLAGYCRYGYTKEALAHFERMSQEVEVNAVSFVSLLAACSHGGLVDEGMRYFESISAIFKMSPTLDHYACIIDLLGRAGHLHEAEVLIRQMPCEPDAPVWMSLLAACKIHGNVEMGERVAKRVMILDPGDSAGYVLLSNIYAAANKWYKVEAVSFGKLNKDVKKRQSAPGLR